MTTVLEGLRKRGLREVSDSDVICRWRLGSKESGVLVDVMPTNGEILGFSNRWYASAVATAVPHDINGYEVSIIDAVHFIATKIEAFSHRGADDFYASHDLEDILTVVNGRSEIVAEVAAASTEIRSAIVEVLTTWLNTGDFLNALEGHVDYGRDAIVEARLREIAGG